MLIDCLLSLKRKYFAIAEECDGDEENTQSDLCSPRKRLRVHSRASIDEANKPNELASFEVAPEKDGNVPIVEETKKLGRAGRVKELEEANERLKKEAEQLAAKIKKIAEEDVECMICHDLMQNPQLYAIMWALGLLWLPSELVDTTPEDYDAAEIIDTEPEEDTSDVTIVVEDPIPRSWSSRPSATTLRSPSTHIFFGEVRCRPVPNLQLRAVVETLRKDLAQPPSSIQPRPPRRDLWHGIFHPETEKNQQERQMRRFMPRLQVEPRLHPDPILNDFAQGQHREAVEEAAARRERERAGAFEEGRMIGIIEGRRQRDRERAEQAQQVAINRRLGEQDLVPGNAPPIPQQPPVEVPDVPQDPVPHILDAVAVPPPREDAPAM
ncbi:hypothetical protein Clacol_009371 [Clathrus columnatus]|uniref:Uncharacterized protein n=1 Tax=Clathrus columnatus TaxID=1419009 RepID=A0AAV5ARW2_9AGAM|nr:hypothetical protein Clacol_009371 [Clathrus columnatus]